MWRRFTTCLQRQLAAYKLMIIDELGYVPLSTTGAELLFEVFSQRYDEPSANNQAIRLEPNLTIKEIADSAVTANALLLLRRAQETGGLKLTDTGNLSRAVVGECVESSSGLITTRMNCFGTTRS